MAKVSPLMVAPPLVFAALAGLFFWGMAREDADVLPSQLIGKPVPPVELSQLGPTPLLTNEVLAEPGVKLVNFWGTWCVACRAEHPTLLWMRDNLDVPLHGINFDDTTARALAYLEEDGNPFAALGEAKTARTKIDWGVYGAPETFIIDANGIVVLRWAGPITKRVLESDILPAIEKAKAAGSGS
ncbi:DsbE family thiol:disulfide interchange protein [Alisedimentitalea sp. MJ-SS2]|uniref:DsbE family thiol:disulfide interchange protein n=1 Tax=Aliisedimentitalea sp. MJ-SS2 TaxID=3049795 RepID=UPI0029060A29|nr:DsbE family thiol:disulfide interchange protein [Alisedimentitalea sp. MJ-SS2]MDU8926415.1 DsbE family thiol:disulfide interchange protein [Alisedimentitalea sp. MJ-SS2]